MEKEDNMKKAKLILLAGLAIAVSLTGCQKKEVKPGDVAGYDEGEQYLSIWVHSIEDTLEGQVYRESVDSFNEKYNGKYFADIEFIPRNDSGGGYSDKVNSSVKPELRFRMQIIRGHRLNLWIF